MESAIVTLRIQGKSDEYDLEIPYDATAGAILQSVLNGVGLTGQPQRYGLRSDPPGRVMNPGETLAQAGAWDGAVLTVVIV